MSRNLYLLVILLEVSFDIFDGIANGVTLSQRHAEGSRSSDDMPVGCSLADGFGKAPWPCHSHSPARPLLLKGEAVSVMPGE